MSWNRYAYANDDPINRADPTGRSDCGADWVSDASLSGPCYEDGSGGYGGGGSGFIAVSDPNPTVTSGERKKRQAAIDAALAAIAAKLITSLSAKIPLWPAAIQFFSSCYTKDALTNSYEFDVTYQILSELGSPMTGADLSGVSIKENFLAQTGNLGDLNAQAGTWVYPKSIGANGQFTDYLSSGSTPMYGRAGTSLQEFTAYVRPERSRWIFFSGPHPCRE